MRLVYVSALVFGDAASFLLPWKRVLKVTDAQVGIHILGAYSQLGNMKFSANVLILCIG